VEAALRSWWKLSREAWEARGSWWKLEEADPRSWWKLPREAEGS